MRHSLIFTIAAEALVISLLIPTLALAGQQTITYKLSAGTGFVVNNDGHVITNAHVVSGCQSISILTPAGEQPAELVATDTKNDLAALKTEYSAKSVAPLRDERDPLTVGSNAIVIGYPGNAGVSGKAQFQKTPIKSLEGPDGDSSRIQLARVAQKGNSGGPLLDTSGRVIGVVSGATFRYRADSHGQPIGKPIGQADLAISLDALRDFLQQHRIHFTQPDRRLLPRNTQALRAQATSFIVPVRCVTDVIRQP